MNTVLVVEDEQDILELIEYTLSKDGYDVIGCFDTSNILQILDEEEIDLILMDRNLPGTEGSVFVQNMRNKGYVQPVVYLTAKDGDSDILQGFERGADDYITKPFNLDVLRARVKAILKRVNKDIEVMKIKDIVYQADNRKFFIDDKEVVLTHLEHDLLLTFFKNRDILLTRDVLLDNVWQDSTDVKPKTVNVAVKRLKEKIDPTGDKKYIRSVRGEGYIFC